MRRFLLRFNLDNDIFSMDERQEVANILKQCARDVVLADLHESRPIMERNGNTVGKWEFIGKKEK